MNIGYDAKRAVCNHTGLGNYSRLVMQSYAVRFPEDNLVAFTPVMRDNPRLSKINSIPHIRFATPDGLWKKFPSLWRSFGITASLPKNQIDIFHGLSNELPLNIKKSGIPSVVTIHDVIYRRMPECYHPADRLIYDFKYGSACRNADRIIAISRRTASDICDIYGIDPAKIDIIYQGCDESFRITADDDLKKSVAEKYDLPKRYIVQVGTVERRKNLALTVKALSTLPPDIHLVVVGKATPYKEEVVKIAEELGVASRIKWLEGVPFGFLPAIYQMAEVVVYPSRYEGFGLPVLEGLASMRPVVAATGSCLEEAGGDAAIYVDPDSPSDLADALHSILSDNQLYDSMVEKGRIHEAKFNNSEIPVKLKAVYEKTIRQFKAQHNLQ